MVQLKCNQPRPYKGTPDDTYWAIGTPLKPPVREQQRDGKKIYAVDPEAQKDRDRVNRKERGLPDYEDCSAAELLNFIQSRGLNISISTLPDLSTNDTLHIDESDLEILESNKKDHIAILQKADDAATFNKFLELAPELRTIIYEKYHENFVKLPTLPQQPPLAFVSKQIRAEALPIFFAESTFILRLHENVQDNALNRTPLAVSTYNARNDSDLLTSSALSAHHLSRITRIQLRLHWTYGHKIKESGCWDIDFGCEAGLLVHEDWLRCSSELHRDFCHENVRAAIRRVFLGIWARSETRKFRRSDIEDLRAAVHAALASVHG